MADEDPWAAFRTGAAVAPASEAATDPWTVYRAPGLSTPRPPPPELRASPDDKYKAKALADYDKAKAAGFEPPTGYAQRIGLGTGLGWTDDVAAGISTPFKMIQHGTLDIPEAYRYGRADIDLLQNATRENTKGFWGTAAELAGGLIGAGGVLGGTRATAKTIPAIPGVMSSKTIPAGAVNWGLNTAKGAGLGAVAGAGEAESYEGIPRGLMLGGVLGGAGAAVLPAVAAGVGHGARILQAPRLRDPENIAIEQVAAAARAGGVTPQQIFERVRDANAAGQPFTVADAIGKEGHRKLGGVYKGPGPHRETITETLTARDLNMPYRVIGKTDQTLGAHGTAEQASEALAQRAAAEAAPIYRQAEQHPSWSNRLQEFLDHPDMQQGLRHGYRLERRDAVTEGRAFNPHDAMITDFNAAGDPIITGVPNMRTLDMAKRGLDHMIEQSMKDGRATVDTRSLTRFKNTMLAELDAINPTYAQGRRAYADPMQIRDAVQAGREMAAPGRRYQDTIQEFQGMRGGEPGGVAPQFSEQQGARIGYADKLAEQTQGGILSPLLRARNTKGQQELEALSLEQGPRNINPRTGQPEPSMTRQFLNREETMKAGTNKILGGSDTAEKIADAAASPGGADAFNAVSSIVMGNPVGAVQAARDAFNRIRSGESEAQRVAITKSLLENLPDKVKQMADRIAIHEERRRGVNPWTGTYRYRPGE